MAPPYVRLPQAPVATTVNRQSFTKQSPFHRVIIEQSLKKSDFAARRRRIGEIFTAACAVFPTLSQIAISKMKIPGPGIYLARVFEGFLHIADKAMDHNGLFTAGRRL